MKIFKNMLLKQRVKAKTLNLFLKLIKDINKFEKNINVIYIYMYIETYRLPSLDCVMIYIENIRHFASNCRLLLQDTVIVSPLASLRS